jgi:hypothetical protein
MIIVFGLALIVAFAVVAILIDPADPREEPYEPRDRLPYWASLGRH